MGSEWVRYLSLIYWGFQVHIYPILALLFHAWYVQQKFYSHTQIISVYFIFQALAINEFRGETFECDAVTAATELKLSQRPDLAGNPASLASVEAAPVELHALFHHLAENLLLGLPMGFGDLRLVDHGKFHWQDPPLETIALSA